MELSYLLVKYLGKSKFQLTLDYSYSTKNYLIKIPAGFITDFASIPPFLQIFINKYGEHNSASIIHDWLYSKECYLRISRLEADRIFLEIMLENKVNKIKAHIMYRAVRIFGKKYFRR